MSAENAAALEREYVSRLLGRIRPQWLAGYAGAWKEWQGVPARLGAAVGKVADVLLSTVDPAVMPDGVDPEVFRVQVFNLIRQAEGGPLARARQLLAAEPPRFRGGAGWRFGMLGFGIEYEDIWHRPFAGLIYGPIWDLIVPAWRALTPEVRAAIARSVGEAPAELTTPEAFAWLEWAASRPGPRPWRSILAMRGLTADEWERLAMLAAGQHEAWAARGLLRPNHDHQGLTNVAWEFLSPVRYYAGGSSAELDARIHRAGVHIPLGAYRADEEDDDEPYFRQGFALVAPSEVDEVSPAVRAGHGEAIAVGRFPESLLVVLDLDLTRPELAFLGLEGTRLRVCDWATHRGRLCYTRVGLDGEVRLMRRTKGADDDEAPDEEEGLVLGPAFASPIADMPQLGWSHLDARIGGSPGWEQEPEWPKSPDNRCPMTFLAQFPHPNGGTAYAFLDPLNLIATVRTQWD